MPSSSRRCCCTLALALLLGCTVEAPPPTPAAAWSPRADPVQDPVAAAAEIDALADPIARVAAVNALADADVPITWTFCAALQDASARQRCERFVTRPHLTEEAMSQPERDRDRAAPGPPAGLLAPRPGVASSLSVAAPADDRCAAGDDACHRKEAALVARLGQAEAAAGLCAAIADPRWSQECRFEAAEAAAKQRGADGQQDMAELCLGTGGYQARCFHHGARLLATAAPDAAAPPEAWDPLRESAASMAVFWTERDPAFGRWQQDRLWSYALWQAMAHTPTPGAGSLTGLPPEATPHIRQALALRMMPEAPRSAGLDARLQALNEALDFIPPVFVARGRPERMHPGAPLWPTDVNAEDEAMPAAFCLGSSRRTVSPDRDVDGRIVLLEAAARQTPPLTALLQEGSQEADPQVQWTARRLLRGSPPPPTDAADSPPPHPPSDRRGG